MNGFRLENPMCRRPRSTLSPSDYTTSYENDNTGGKIKVTQFKDGSCTYHHGGPVGDAHYDDLGEEC